MKYLQAFLAEIESAENTTGIVPAKPAKGGFDGFAGSSHMVLLVKEQVSQSTAMVANEADEIKKIVTVWRDLVGVRQDPDRLREHLAALKRWEKGGKTA